MKYSKPQLHYILSTNASMKCVDGSLPDGTVTCGTGSIINAGGNCKTGGVANGQCQEGLCANNCGTGVGVDTNCCVGGTA